MCKKNGASAKFLEVGSHIYIYIYICTFISLVLIFLRAPMSSTGVLPVELLIWSGPIFGRGRPYFSVSPRINLVKNRSKESTCLMGSHLRRNTERPNVEMPSISLGNTWIWKKTNTIHISINVPYIDDDAKSFSCFPNFCYLNEAKMC